MVFFSIFGGGGGEFGVSSVTVTVAVNVYLSHEIKVAWNLFWVIEQNNMVMISSGN
jgi:hypothetical protein